MTTNEPPTEQIAAPAEPDDETATVVSVDMASRSRGVVVAEVSSDRDRAIRITDLTTDESPAELPLVSRTEQGHDDIAATAGMRASDVEAAGRLRRNGCHRAAQEMMLCSVRQQADRVGIPSEFAL